MARAQRWQALAAAQGVDGSNTHPMLFCSLHPVTEKQRRTDWFCHAFLGCDFPAFEPILRAIVDTPSDERNALLVEGRLVHIMNLHDSGGFNWGTTNYKGSGNLICENTFDIRDRVVDFPISCTQVGIDERRLGNEEKITEKQMTKLSDDTMISPQQLLQLRCVFPASDANYQRVPERIDLLHSTQPVNYVFRRLKPGQSADVDSTWGMKNYHRYSSAQVKSPARKSKLNRFFQGVPSTVSNKVKIRRKAQKPNRNVNIYAHQFSSISAVTGEAKEFRSLADWCTDQIEGTGEMPFGPVIVCRPSKHQRGTIYQCADMSFFRRIQQPMINEKTRHKAQQEQLCTILKNIRRLIAENDAPLLFACMFGTQIIVFHHGDLRGLLDVMTVGFCSFVDNTGKIPRSSLGPHVRQNPDEPSGPPVRSTCSFFFSTTKYRDPGRKHNQNREQVVEPWPQRVYHKGFADECITVGDRLLSISEVGPVYNPVPRVNVIKLDIL